MFNTIDKLINKAMLKLRLKKIGRKKTPAYRIVIMNNTMKRDGYSIADLGFYNPINKEFKFKNVLFLSWLKKGIKPTKTVINLLKRAQILI
jgi:small subunit ribosomal protein S16